MIEEKNISFKRVKMWILNLKPRIVSKFDKFSFKNKKSNFQKEFKTKILEKLKVTAIST